MKQSTLKYFGLILHISKIVYKKGYFRIRFKELEQEIQVPRYRLGRYSYYNGECYYFVVSDDVRFTDEELQGIYTGGKRKQALGDYFRRNFGTKNRSIRQDFARNIIRNRSLDFSVDPALYETKPKIELNNVYFTIDCIGGSNAN